MNESSSCCPHPPKRKRKRKEVAVFSPPHATDRISQLPRPILHHILSFLRTTTVIRTGVLSKTWYQTSTSFPISHFCQSLVGHEGTTKVDSVQVLLDFVRKSLQSQSRNYGSIPRFALSIVPYSRHASSIEDCIQLAVQNNVKELDIQLERDKARFLMPQTLFSSKELILLSLYGCQLSLPPTHCIPNWPFLLKLRLDHCHIDGQIIQNLTFSCPLLESLSLCYCDGLGDIRLSDLAKLTEFEIDRKAKHTRDTITLELDVPCLQTFSFYSVRGRCNVDLTACKNITHLRWTYFRPNCSVKDLEDLIAGLPALKSLELSWGYDRIRFSSQRLENFDLTVDHIAETDLRDLIAGLPALKSLALQCLCDRIKFSSQPLEKLHLSVVDELRETDLTELIAGLPSLNSLSLTCKCERIKFSSQRLEELKLSVSELVEVSIDAPNLKTFTCSKRELSCDLFMGRSNPQEVNIHFLSDTSLSVFNLRKFLAGFKEIKLLRLCLSPNRLLPAELIDIPVVPTLPDIKHLRILPRFGFFPARADCAALLKGLLWSCRPESISVNYVFYGNFIAVVFCEELGKMVSGQHCCMQCGFHGLRSFKIKQAEADTHFMLEW